MTVEAIRKRSKELIEELQEMDIEGGPEEVIATRAIYELECDPDEADIMFAEAAIKILKTEDQ